MWVIFQKKDKKGQKMLKKTKKGKILKKNWAKMYKIWKYSEKGQVIVCDYRMQ